MKYTDYQVNSRSRKFGWLIESDPPQNTEWKGTLRAMMERAAFQKQWANKPYTEIWLYNSRPIIAMRSLYQEWADFDPARLIMHKDWKLTISHLYVRVKDPETVLMPYNIIYSVSEMGRSYDVIECPICGCEFQGYIWSLAGSGKKCPQCGTKHGLYGAYVEQD